MAHHKPLLILLLLSLISLSPAYAENEYTNSTFWLNLKTKLTKYLDQHVNKSIYKYKIDGPIREMKNFLGNRPNAKIRFEKLNLNTPSHRKNIIAVALDEQGKRGEVMVIGLDVWIYKKVYMLRKPMRRNEDVDLKNVYQKTIPIKQMNRKLYFDDNINQKVATRDLKAGTPIMVNMLRHEKIIQAGDTIEVKTGTGMIELEFICKAINSADKGDMVTLHCPDMNRKTLKAEVTGPGAARLL